MESLGAVRPRLSVKWCGRPESNRHSLAADGFSYHFGFRRRPDTGTFVVWTIPSPCSGIGG